MKKTLDDQLRYLGELVPYLATAVILITVGALAGVGSVLYVPAVADRFVSSFAEFAKMFMGLPKLQLALAIFFNNGFKTLAIVILGIAGGVLPVFSLLMNGFAIGVLLYLTAQSKGALVAALAVLPHGVLELPAVLIGSAMGLRLGVCAVGRWLGRSWTPIGEEFKRAMLGFFVVVIPVLLFAAFIEAFVTAAIFRR